MNHIQKLFLVFCMVLGGTGAMAQNRKNLLMPPQVDMTRRGWNVTLQNGNLTLGFPLANVPGEVPIPVAFGLNATYTATSKKVNYFDPDSNQRLTEQDEIDRPMVGGLHFGYISEAGLYGEDSVDGLTVLESGLQIMDSEWTAFSSHAKFGTTLNLPQAYDFTAVAASEAMVDPTATYLTYTTSAIGLGATYQALAQGLPLSDFGLVNSNYKVVLDKNKARIYGYATSLHAWLPLIWADRFGHYVTFKWTRATTGLPDGVAAITSVTATNRSSKGVVVRWADYTTNATPVAILRLDFVGMYGPSVLVKGYPGYAMIPPTGFQSALPAATNSWTVVPSNLGAACRPTSIQVGAYDSIDQPAWNGYGPSAPGAPSSDGTSPSATQTWSFTYDSVNAELVSYAEPNGLKTQFTYTTYAVQQSTIGQLQPRGISLVQAVDSASGKQSMRWTRTFPVGTTPMSIKVEGWWDPDQMASPDRYHQIGFPADTLNYDNGVYQSDTLMDTAGKTWSTTTNAYYATGAGVDGSLSAVQTVRVVQDGAPAMTTSFSYVDSMNLQVASVNILASDTTKVSTTATTYTPRWDMLEKGQVTQVVTTRYMPDGVTPFPSITRQNVFDPVDSGKPLLQLQKSYLDGGTVGQHGATYEYDTEGRPHLQKVYHLEKAQALSVSSYQSVSYDTATGFPNYQGTTDTSTNPPCTIGTIVSAFDSAGRATAVQDASGVTTNYTYDDRGRTLSTSRPGSPSVTYAYPDENQISITSNGQTATSTYDGFGRLIQVLRPSGVSPSSGAVVNTKVTHTYDQYGRLVATREVNPAGTSRSQGWGYDHLDRVTSQTPAAGSAVIMTYGVVGINRKVVTTLANDVSSTTWLDPLGQTIQVDSPDGTVTHSTYDGAGHQTSLTITPATGTPQSRSWLYDALGRLTTKTEPETNTQAFQDFNALNEPTTLIEASGSADDARTRILAYDAFGRLLRITNGADSLAYTYTGPNLTNATRTTSLGAVSQAFTYSGPGGRLSAETTTQPNFSSTIGYLYDALGRLKTLNYPSGRAIGYGYDTLSRVNSITNGTESLVDRITFDDWGNRWQTNFASGAQDQWDADLTGTRLKNWSIGYVGGGPDGRSYTYDDATNILTAAGEWALTPDPKTGRLKEADGFGIKTAHDYDAFGNATYHRAETAATNGSAVPPTFHNFDLNPMTNNQIPGSAKNGALTGWHTNLRGEATQVGAATISGAALGLTWDGLGLVKSVVWNAGNQSYLYAPSGLRVNLTDTVSFANNRNYAYTAGGLLLSEYTGSAPNVHGGQKALRIPHRPDQFSGCAKYLGTFNAGEVVTATVWFKAPSGVHGELFLGDAGGADPYDQCGYTSGTGNGGWQQLTLSHTMTHADQMWVHLYSDQWSVANSALVPAHAGTVYDDLVVTGSGHGVVLSDGFEGAWPQSASSSVDPGAWAMGVDGVAQEIAGQSGLAWRRDVVYLGSQAVAEIDANGVHELHSDHLGSPRLITKGAGTWASSLIGTAEATQAYGPYGELLSQTGSHLPTTGYTGHLQTDASGLIYMRGRYYSPAWHAFVNSDQGADSGQWNQRAYVGGSPFMGTDPSGMAENQVDCVDGLVTIDGIPNGQRCTGGSTGGGPITYNGWDWLPDPEISPSTMLLQILMASSRNINLNILRVEFYAGGGSPQTPKPPKNSKLDCAGAILSRLGAKYGRDLAIQAVGAFAPGVGLVLATASLGYDFSNNLRNDPGGLGISTLGYGADVGDKIINGGSQFSHAINDIARGVRPGTSKFFGAAGKALPWIGLAWTVGSAGMDAYDLYHSLPECK